MNRLSDEPSIPTSRTTDGPSDPWWRFRRARRLQRYGLALFGLAALLVLLDNFGPPIAWSYAIAPVGMTGLLLWMIGGWRHRRLPCPRCTAPFFTRHEARRIISNPYARRCMNCGLQRWAEPGKLHLV